MPTSISRRSSSMSRYAGQRGAFRHRWLCGLVDKDASVAKLQRDTTKACLINTAKIWRFEFTLLAPSLERHRPTRARAQISKRRERGREAYFNSRETRYETRGGMYFFTMSAYFFALATSDFSSLIHVRTESWSLRHLTNGCPAVQLGQLQVDAFATENMRSSIQFATGPSSFPSLVDRA